MIKFFRKIRYDLIEKNKTGKYLKYAVGEIVLVVIGILIALSINNSNTINKQRIRALIQKHEKEYGKPKVARIAKELSVSRTHVYNVLNEK